MTCARETPSREQCFATDIGASVGRRHLLTGLAGIFIELHFPRLTSGVNPLLRPRGSKNWSARNRAVKQPSIAGFVVGCYLSINYLHVTGWFDTDITCQSR